MPPVFKTIINISVWILFIKGLLIALATLYTAGRAFMAGETLPIAEPLVVPALSPLF
jgi:hypothetical protein